MPILYKKAVTAHAFDNVLTKMDECRLKNALSGPFTSSFTGRR